MTGDITFLDANVFMYAAGTEHPYKQPCIMVLSDLEQRKLKAAINQDSPVDH